MIFILNRNISKGAISLILTTMMIAPINLAYANNIEVDLTIKDIEGSWAKKELTYFYNKGMLSSYNNELRPEKNVTRAEFITFVNRVLEFDALSADKSQIFTDVSTGSWYHREVSKAVRAGYISTNSSKFRPNDEITREEAATILTNIFKNKDTNLDKIAKFKDSDETSDWAKTSVEGAIEAGYIKGSNGEINPKGKVSRAQMAAMLYRTYTKPLDIEGHWAEQALLHFFNEGMITASDNELKPEKSVTRAEFITFVNKVIGFDSMATDRSRIFTDVPSNEWYAVEVSKAVRAGYISTNSSKFRPNDNITRQEAAAILTNIFGNKDTTLDKIAKFKDSDKISGWAKTSMEGAIEAGYIKGRNNGTELSPTEDLNRAEMAAMLYRTIDQTN